jgi:hypothetical protein
MVTAMETARKQQQKQQQQQQQREVNKNNRSVQSGDRNPAMTKLLTVVERNRNSETSYISVSSFFFTFLFFRILIYFN